MTAAPSPLTAVTFAPLIERFGVFEPAPHLAVAVSGGRDSMALLHLADAWARDRGGSTTALIVDHGLRAAAAQEAAATRDALRKLAIDAVMLRADGPPTGNLQAWARHQRYALMNAWCRHHGVLHLLVAHHAGDLAETALAALTRDAGLAGVAGMAAVRELPDCRLLRPLLDIPRDRLEATLAQQDIGWIDDPSNRDRRFRRVRLRQKLSGTSEAGTLAKRAIRAGRARCTHDRHAADLLAETVRIDGDTLSIECTPLTAAEPETVSAIIAALVGWVGERRAPPRQARIGAITDWTMSPDAAGQRTLGGCVLAIADGRLSIRPQPARSPSRLSRQPDQRPALFDGSFGAVPLTKPFGNSEVARVG